MIDIEDFDIIIKDRVAKGPSFCHVDRMRQGTHDIDDITLGNHEWHGAIPSLSISAKIRISKLMFDGIKVLDHSDDDAIRIILDPRA